jgi:hypothetical protein
LEDFGGLPGLDMRILGCFEEFIFSSADREGAVEVALGEDDHGAATLSQIGSRHKERDGRLAGFIP